MSSAIWTMIQLGTTFLQSIIIYLITFAMIRRGYWAHIINPFLYMSGQVEAMVDVPTFGDMNVKVPYMDWTSLEFWISHDSIRSIHMIGMH